MSFRRMPFQFTTSDPAERQRELEKRFGVSSHNKMYVDAANPLTKGSGLNTSTSSPRFQHRVPMFADGKPSQSSVDSSVCENKTPKVRIVPIEIEKNESLPSSRHRTFSGPAEITGQHNNEVCAQKDDASTLKRSMDVLSKPSKIKAASGPRVYNIPIKVEPSGVREKKTKAEKGKVPVKSHPKENGCGVSKLVQNDEPEPSSSKEAEPIEDERMKTNINNSLKKINCVLEELKSYETGVNDFNGTAKNKQYRYLDEMLTRCMIKLDDIETMGNEEVRSARKKAVKMVQACIDLLESKVNIASNCETVNTFIKKTETIEKQDHVKQSTVLEEEENVNKKCNMIDLLEENQLVAKSHESKLPQTEFLISDTSCSECKPDVPEVEMAEVTSSSDVNQKEKTGIDNLVSDQSQPNATHTISDEILAQPSVSNEIEMTEVISQINNSQDQKQLPKPEVSSTNILHLEKVPIEPTLINDSNEAEMSDVSSTLKNYSDIQKVEAVPEVSSSIIQPEKVASNIEQFPVETVISEHCKAMKNVKTGEADNYSNSDTNLQSSIPEVEMKNIVENSCETNNNTLDDEQSNLQSKCSSSNDHN